MPRHAVTYRKRMPVWERLAHGSLLIVTFGLWAPVYRRRKHEFETTTYTEFH